jgi:hypothetical protein
LSVRVLTHLLPLFRLGTFTVFGALYYKAATHKKEEKPSSSEKASDKIADLEKQPLKAVSPQGK